MLHDNDQDLRFSTQRDINQMRSVELEPKPAAYSGFVGQDNINIGNGSFGAENRNPAAAI